MEFGGLDLAPVFLTKQFSQLTLIFLTILKQSDRIWVPMTCTIWLMSGWRRHNFLTKQWDPIYHWTVFAGQGDKIWWLLAAWRAWRQRQFYWQGDTIGLLLTIWAVGSNFLRMNTFVQLTLIQFGSLKQWDLIENCGWLMQLPATFLINSVIWFCRSVEQSDLISWHNLMTWCRQGLITGQFYLVRLSLSALCDVAQFQRRGAFFFMQKI